ncbi:MAG: ferrous iron transport protein B [bacterium]
MIALAGNPNSGKTTIFNALTGARQHVGNYPGVTVEKKEGACSHNGNTLRIVDLPGTYSLTAYSIEEVVARDFLIDEKPDVVIDIVDASNLERNLYLAVQLMEIGVPLVLAFNMSDMARSRGIEFDLERLSELLGVPIVQTVGHKGLGMADLLDAAVGESRKQRRDQPFLLDYGREVEEARGRIAVLLREKNLNLENREPEWVALKLLENDAEIQKKIQDPDVASLLEESSRHIESILGNPPEIAVADSRYGFISGACQECVRSSVEKRHQISDHIDAVVTNRVLALPIFAALMYGVFHLVFTLGGPPMDWLDAFFGWAGESVAGFWAEGSESPLKSLLVDGVIGGVGGVVIFLPNILFLFLAIAILEDSGYMARAAFIMDRFMHKIGLHGKSFIPMLIGFGCSVPAIMATRSLENQRDRLTTMLVAPLMSCGARLPIYMLIIPAFFPAQWHAPMLWLIYVIGIVLAIVLAKVLRSTLFKGETEPFVMELPPYRMPTIKSVSLHMWGRSWLYLKKAGTLILGVSIVLWAMTSYPKKPEHEADYGVQIEQAEAAGDEELVNQLAQARQAEELSYTLAGRVGKGLEPVLQPMGFDWRIGTALIGAFAAKEVFVAQMGIVYSLGETDEESDSLRDQLRSNYTPLVGFCIMLFCLISAPCMATIAVTRRESNSWKWALVQLGGLTVLAWLITVIVYQVGSALGIGL